MNEDEKKREEVYMKLIALANAVKNDKFGGIIAYVDKNEMVSHCHFLNLNMLLEADRYMVTLVKHITSLGEAEIARLSQEAVKMIKEAG